MGTGGVAAFLADEKNGVEVLELLFTDTLDGPGGPGGVGLLKEDEDELGLVLAPNEVLVIRDCRLLTGGT